MSKHDDDTEQEITIGDGTDGASAHAEAARAFGEAARACAEAAKALAGIDRFCDQTKSAWKEYAEKSRQAASDLAVEALKEGAHAIGDLAFGKAVIVEGDPFSDTPTKRKP